MAFTNVSFFVVFLVKNTNQFNKLKLFILFIDLLVI